MNIPIILDACTVINLLRVDEDEFLYKHIMSMPKVHIAETVYNEIQKNIFNNPLNEEKLNLINSQIPNFLTKQRKDSEIKKDIHESDFDKIFSLVKQKRENGELFSSILSLLISREENTRVCFYTDDYPAQRQFKDFFEYQHIGMIGDSIDLVLFLYWSKCNFTVKKLRSILLALKCEYAIDLQKVINELQNIKDKLERKDRKDKEGCEDIIQGFYNGDIGRMSKGITIINNSSNKSLKKVFTKYPNFNKSYELVNKVNKILAYHNKYPIFTIQNN